MTGSPVAALLLLAFVIIAAKNLLPDSIKAQLETLWRTVVAPDPVRQPSPLRDKNLGSLTPGRRPGEWTSTPFLYPTVEASPEGSELHKPLPFRPFRWGDKYPINLGVYPMKWDMWLEVDSEYLHTHSLRRERMTSRGAKACRILPWDYPLVPSSIPMAIPAVQAPYEAIPPERRATPLACAKEVLSEMASYLALRYPSLYRVTYGPLKPPTGETFDIDSTGNSFVVDRRVKTIELVETGEKWDVDEEDPMKVCGMLLQDDLAIMQEREDGQVYFCAGNICLAGFWRMEDKIGLPLDEIHQRGKVPKFKEKLQFSMNRFFLKLAVEKPVVRNNYFFQVGEALAWSDRTSGPEDEFDQGSKGPRAGAEAAKTFIPPSPTKDVHSIWYRSERQTLRRMPKTGCILFTIRTYFLPVSEMVAEPGVPGRMANAIRTWPKDVAWYKALELYGDALLPWLDELHQKQIADGSTTADNQDRTYPF